MDTKDTKDKKDKKEKKDTQKVGVKVFLEYQQAVSYLEDLLASLKAGKVVVSKEGESVTMTPPSHVSMELEARSKGDKKKFTFEMAWTENEDACVTISDKEPEISTKDIAEEKTEEGACSQVSGKRAGDDLAKRKRIALLMQQQRTAIKRRKIRQAKEEIKNFATPVTKPSAQPKAKAAVKPATKVAEKPAPKKDVKPVAKASEKASPKTDVKPAAKSAAKSIDKTAAKKGVKPAGASGAKKASSAKKSAS